MDVPVCRSSHGPPNPRAAAPQRPRIGVVKFASCDGCQLTLLDLEDELLAIAERVDIVEFAEATSRRSAGPFDVLFVEGSISTPEQAEEIVRLRAVTHRLLVTIGACATAGGIQAIRNWFDHEEVRAAVYPEPRLRRVAGAGPPGRRLRRRRRRAARLPDLARPAARVPRRARDRPAAAAPRRGGLPRVQAARRGLRRRRPGHPVPRSRHPDRLRRDLPGLRPRLLRLLRAARIGQHGRAGDVAGGRPSRRPRSAACSPASPPGPGRSGRSIDAHGGPPGPDVANAGDRPMHDTDIAAPASGDLAVDIAGLTRVEGEGSLRLRVRDGVVEEAHLEIFEAPRYFERLVVGRTPDEVIDIVARICGICPVAYQMTAVHAFEARARDRGRPGRSGRSAGCSTAASGSRATRSTSTCSTCPTSSATRARSSWPGTTAPAVEAGPGPQEGRQPDRRAHRRPGHPPGLGPGRRLLAVVPADARSRRCAARSTEALEIALQTVDLVAGLDTPTFERDGAAGRPPPPDRVPDERGPDRVDRRARHRRDRTGAPSSASSRSRWSNALQARGRDGRPYLLGPAARITLDARPAPSARGRRRWPGPAWPPRSRSTRTGASWRGRSSSSTRPPRRSTSSTPTSRPTRGAHRLAAGAAPSAAWATEAPRGLIFHAYELDDRGLVAHAQIVPPTSQNQAAIEADLAAFAPQRPRPAARARRPSASSS